MQLLSKLKKPKMKTCKLCKVNKPYFEYFTHATNSDKLYSFCKPCCRKKGNEYRLRNKGQSRRGHLRRRYNLTELDYLTMFEKQNGLCAICKKPETIIRGLSKRAAKLSIDHNHITGTVRGLFMSIM